MKAQSADYIELQDIYKTKARRDFAEVTSRVRSMELELGRKSPVDDREIEAFCKGAAFIKLIRGRPIRVPSEQDIQSWTENASIRLELQDENSLLPIYISFLAYDQAIEDLPPLPFSLEAEEEEEEEGPFNPPTPPAQLHKLMSNFTDRLFAPMSASGLDPHACKANTQSILAEWVRAAGAELHNISALTGGMVAQEVIKVITKQYVPVDGTCVFDGVRSRTMVFKL